MIVKEIAICLTFSLALAFSWPVIAGEDAGFENWIAAFRAEAQEAGISSTVLDDAFIDLHEPDADVLALDQKQPEKTRSFPDYAAGIVNAKKVAKARELWASHQMLLQQIEAQYHVPPQIILALWGIESNFGKNQGSYSVTESLATLAYDGRRSAFFRKELLNALRIMQSEHIDANSMTGSWAGAMGQTQFMPTSFLSFAVDFDQDGKRDIWNDDADALASIANYLHQKGWNPAYGWGMRVAQPGSGNAAIPATRKATVAQWQQEGIMAAGPGTALADDLPVRLVMPDNLPASSFIVTSNYDVLMDWNRSTYFATAVGLLADAIGR